jgi:hypothetical protein
MQNSSSRHKARNINSAKTVISNQPRMKYAQVGNMFIDFFSTYLRKNNIFQSSYSKLDGFDDCHLPSNSNTEWEFEFSRNSKRTKYLFAIYQTSQI